MEALEVVNVKLKPVGVILESVILYQILIF